ncbi:MAG TPA: bacillithiol biosynthesis cysteine-adding enzyme BshC [Pyrinomonadaceae bacterium]|nr:bacillithiol biosynthesis cysteine-adding enzyme BshC [Chloracidobacterium sp.]MBP9935319.1 bacillithiol biosynthesis cysteine-adding enzyme BshC [Pyrinomonadaceae bacterium]MBK7804531.1 bacillithiol biosynthesis cysteine-adding enzyme BshC [Chloracidobacterium sp.]MBK9768860.1 bacillithiol biosynthesis cysteine-adding enzyme BshC [Chloracidobacterium sp.]MBL0240456.1 bacillithiol biosynthesis cysteine-adding enzyme BshC [Chloracidobacterium sp.]
MEQEIACQSRSGAVTLRAESIPFSDFPGQSRLFIDYQTDPLSLKKYYPQAIASQDDIASLVPGVLANHKADRNVLADALAEINIKFGAGHKTLKNIESLRSPDTVAVVTGQQAGLFSGPLYTIYKAMSAIRQVERLREQGVNAVPVFWVATEDHDFEEVSKTYVIDRQGELYESKTEPSHCYEDLPVGYVKLDSSIKEGIADLIAALSPTEFTAEVRHLIEDSWRPDDYFGDAFGKLLTHLLGDYGLIILCPLHPKLKRLAAPIYVEAIRSSAEIVDALRKRSDELVESGYAAQVLVGEDYFPLFWQAENDTRNALKRTDAGTFRKKDGSREFTLEELAQIAESEPERFSPSVVLRSVAQDYILPTVCYFGGAAEIAYFAQSGEVYRILDRTPTLILHRQSFTFVESKHAKTLSKYGLQLARLFEGFEELLPGIVEKYLNSDSARVFAEVEEAINTQLNRLDQDLSQIDTTLAENLAKRRRKIIYHIGALRNKFYNVQVRKDAVIRQQIEGLFTALLPHKHLQERALNITYFLDRFGLNFIDWIYNAVDLDDRAHRVIRL